MCTMIFLLVFEIIPKKTKIPDELWARREYCMVFL